MSPLEIWPWLILNVVVSPLAVTIEDAMPVAKPSPHFAVPYDGPLAERQFVPADAERSYSFTIYTDTPELAAFAGHLTHHPIYVRAPGQKYIAFGLRTFSDRPGVIAVLNFNVLLTGTEEVMGPFTGSGRDMLIWLFGVLDHYGIDYEPRDQDLPWTRAEAIERFGKGGPSLDWQAVAERLRETGRPVPPDLLEQPGYTPERLRVFKLPYDGPLADRAFVPRRADRAPLLKIEIDNAEIGELQAHLDEHPIFVRSPHSPHLAYGLWAPPGMWTPIELTNFNTLLDPDEELNGPYRGPAGEAIEWMFAVLDHYDIPIDHQAMRWPPRAQLIARANRMSPPLDWSAVAARLRATGRPVPEGLGSPAGGEREGR